MSGAQKIMLHPYRETTRKFGPNVLPCPSGGTLLVLIRSSSVQLFN